MRDNNADSTNPSNEIGRIFLFSLYRRDDSMLELLQLQKLKLELDEYTLFKDVNVSIQQGDIIGIIGKNGAGKSTLLRLLTGDMNPTDGKIQHFQPNLSISMVEQEASSYLFEDVSSSEETLLKKWNVPTGNFQRLSGGEKLKARLARGLASYSDLLLLDEPTNHLDADSTALLIKEIKKYRGTILLVSHDRYFLDQVATKIWSIENQKVIAHSGNYSDYMKHREQARLTQQREYEKQQKMKERINKQMKQLTAWSQSGHARSTKEEGFKEYHRVKAKRLDSQVKSKQKRLEKELEKFKTEAPAEEYQVQFSFTSTHKHGNRFLEVKELEKSFIDRVLFKEANFTIQHGEKVAIIGPNGSGKTTLLQMIMENEAPTKGELWISPSAQIGYLTQEVFDLPLDQTPKELFHRETFEARGHVQNLMKHLGFVASQWNEPIANMSMGERVKCKLMKYILDEKDVLILDEPTNHLDLPSREQLEKTLAQYKGTLLVVSHDHYFVEKVTTVQLVIDNERIKKQIQTSGDTPSTIDDKEKLRLTLETERQEVLGKLSFLTPNHKGYAELDLKFMELTKRIKELQ